MTHRETTLRHLWLAGLGAYARVRHAMDRLAGRPEVVEKEDEVVEFVTTHKPAKRVSSHSSAGRKAGERDAQRRISAKGR